eukprot:SM000174S03368  [mRNA]  locus=s174:289056:295513:+ [translate_table: standard]
MAMRHELQAPPSPARRRGRRGRQLGELTFNSKPIITNLTIIAGENAGAAAGIAAAVCAHVRASPPDRKLPALYLLDSIVKNIGAAYVRHFTGPLPEVFIGAWRAVPPGLRPAMQHLFKTWRGIFPAPQLRRIESALQQDAPLPLQQVAAANGPAAGPPPLETSGGSGRIHVNPKYIEAQHRQRLEAQMSPRAGKYLNAYGDNGRSENGLQGYASSGAGVGPDRAAGAALPAYEADHTPIYRTERPPPPPAYARGASYSVAAQRAYGSASTRRTAEPLDDELELRGGGVRAFSGSSHGEQLPPDEPDLRTLLRARRRSAGGHGGGGMHEPPFADGGYLQQPLPPSQGLPLPDLYLSPLPDMQPPGPPQLQPRPPPPQPELPSPSAEPPLHQQQQQLLAQLMSQLQQRSQAAPPVPQPPPPLPPLQPLHQPPPAPLDGSAMPNAAQLLASLLSSSGFAQAPQPGPPPAMFATTGSTLPPPSNTGTAASFAAPPPFQAPSAAPPSFSAAPPTLPPFQQLPPPSAAAPQPQQGPPPSGGPPQLSTLLSSLISFGVIQAPRGPPAPPPGSFASFGPPIQPPPSPPPPLPLGPPPVRQLLHGPATVAAGPPAELPIGREFRQEVLRERHLSVISALYDDFAHQCKTCGLRFVTQEEYGRHLDAHFQKRKRQKSAKGRSRRWFVTLQEWLAGTAGGTDGEAPPGTAGGGVAGLVGNTAALDEDLDQMAVPADEAHDRCSLCGDKFEVFFNAEEDEWMFRGAIYAAQPGGPIVHAKCRSERDAAAANGVTLPLTGHDGFLQPKLEGLEELPALVARLTALVLVPLAACRSPLNPCLGVMAVSPVVVAASPALPFSTSSYRSLVRVCFSRVLPLALPRPMRPQPLLPGVVPLLPSTRQCSCITPEVAWTQIWINIQEDNPIDNNKRKDIQPDIHRVRKALLAVPGSECELVEARQRLGNVTAAAALLCSCFSKRRVQLQLI